ncbi:MAG: hypothetical protein GF329_01300, partial [Candidatus Lokiarchaeota archaeon]|nr:hypothetical protein [Candidatus Lokiarchaeota archaeon]
MTQKIEQPKLNCLDHEYEDLKLYRLLYHRSFNILEALETNLEDARKHPYRDTPLKVEIERYI